MTQAELTALFRANMAAPPLPLSGRGLVEVGFVAAGGALISTRALRAVAPPHFRFGAVGSPTAPAEDLDFCARARQRGFRSYVDVGVRVGHLTAAGVWPVFSKDGTLSHALDLDFTGPSVSAFE